MSSAAKGQRISGCRTSPVCTNMQRNTRQHNNAHKFTYLQIAISSYTHAHVTHTQIHTHTPSSSYWKNSQANQLPLSQTHSTCTALTSYCALNGSRMLRNCFLCPLAMVFVWLHAYCAVIEPSDQKHQGGSADKPATLWRHCLWGAVHAILKWYTCCL